ncbi:PREDICTED: G patch domain and KOW motifs-containing protein-like [Amphimedon queenslandica]|uniref:G-patch domain-containing protein n=1 Tax=Amphimedon queenslandica TaxID=400682 RepID=A0A1X7VBS3_AMPQE|nr:PREDICTED: G patch domain and KOW motifs-containing protein-like [Amphimedon queenslandica]|eukprot:XP_019849722.1 PREDICTED: G patch domain and KOW motifs-containing protein-like [Amphimedon queenslandica]
MAENITEKATPSVSFKLSATGSNKRGASSFKRSSDTEGNDKQDKDYILSVEDKKLNSAVPKPPPREYIIPLIKTNIWRNPTQDVGVVNPEQATATERLNRLKGVESGSVATPSEETKETDMNIIAAKAILEDIRSGVFGEDQRGGGGGGKAEGGLVIPLIMQNKPPVQADDDKLTDLPYRPEESTLSDYASMPIEHFGSAMLKGMGWKPGQAIGLNKKGLIEPIEYIPHPGGLGLGATPKPPDPKKKNRIKKPGEIEIKRPKPYKDKDGRVRHVKKIGEEIPEEKPEGFHVGNFARVIDGPHEDLYGKIVSVDEKNSTLVLRLVINNENLRFSTNHLEVVSEEEFKRFGRSTNVKRESKPFEKEYGLILSNRSTSSLDSNNISSQRKKRPISPPTPPSISKEEELSRKPKRDPYSGRSEEGETERAFSHKERKDKDGREKRREKDGGSAKRSTRDDSRHKRGKEQIKREREHDDKEKEGRPVKKYSKVSLHKSNDDIWVSSNLKVRIIDKEFNGGKYYNKKVVVIDVIRIDNCICQTEDGRLLEGLSQAMLETIVPKTDEAAVMIVSGERKREFASIIQRNSSSCQALVRVMHSDDILTLGYDELCEYVGRDVSDR